MSDTTIGRPAPRIDARAKVTGEALYPGDLSHPDMLYMKILFARRPHARVVRLDTRRAEAHPGVVAVFTARDVPVNEYGLQFNDQPVLCGPGSDKTGADVVRFVGDQVAAIVAETERAAAEGVKLIAVTYDDLPVLTDPREAMAPGAIQLLPDRPGNLICHYKIRKGDVEAALAAADVVVESEYTTHFQEHAYLQPEAGLAYVDDDGLITVEVGGQWIHTDQKQVAHALGLPPDRIRIIYPSIGGAFGGREDMSVQIVLALAVWRLDQRGIRRPVKIIWSREESIIGHGKRHPMVIKYRSGATRAGKLVAAHIEIIADGGAYCYTTNKVLGNATITCTGPYAIPNVHVDTYGVYTNNIPGAAFRGFGAPQVHFAAEMQMNKLAVALDMDPVELRWRNALREGDTLNVGTPLPGGVGTREVIEAAAKKAGWMRDDAGWHRPPSVRDSGTVPATPGVVRQGLGFAAGFKNVGFSFGYPENCAVRIELHGASHVEEAVVYYAGAEVGQGIHTAVAQMAAEALNLTLEAVRLVLSDTATTLDSGSASASRSTFMAGNAIRGAARQALDQWRAEERPAIGEFKYLAPSTTPFDAETGYSMPNLAYGYVAQAVQVEVDTETGLVRVLRVVSADDVGKAINPQSVQGQIEGAVVQAQGWVVSEDLKVQDGQILNPYLSTYLIPTIADVPARVDSVILEIPDPRGPWGARGMGEMPFLPLAPALVSAVYDATGVWFDGLPLTPERVALGLRDAA
ncbi:MAG: molybdopterin-dependent oxidoreductase [Anaerolineae bacterium]|nr:MAG: molybdopterin-dependent oxidoreductase [Anaerolineae bacterium]